MIAQPMSHRLLADGSLELTIPGRPPTPNARFGNRYAEAAKTRTWRDAARLIGVDAVNRTGWKAPAKARITLTFIVPTHASRDTDNLVASTKPLTDGLRDAKVLVGDNHQVLEWGAPQVEYIRGAAATRYLVEVVIPAHPVLGL